MPRLLKACRLWISYILARGRNVDRIKPGRYYGNTSTTVGTLGWIEMTVRPSPGDDINAWFLFGNATVSDRMPRREDEIVVLKRKSRGNYIHTTVHAKGYKISRRDCWTLPNHQTYAIMLFHVYSKFSIERYGQLTSSFHLCWTSGNWVLFLGSQSRCRRQIDEVSSPVVMVVRKDGQSQRSSPAASSSMVEGNKPRKTGVNNYEPPQDTRLTMMHENPPSHMPSTIPAYRLPLSLAREGRIHKPKPGRYYGNTSTVGTLEWMTMQVLPTNNDDVEAWFLFSSSSDEVRIPLEDPTGEATVVLRQKRVGRSLLATVRGSRTIPRKSCWALPRNSVHTDELYRVYRVLSIKAGPHLTSTFHLCWVSGDWVVFFGSASRCKHEIDEVFLPVILEREGKYVDEAGSRTASGSIFESSRPPFEAWAGPHPSEVPVTPVDWIPQGQMTEANNNLSWDTSMTTMHEASPSRHDGDTRTKVGVPAEQGVPRLTMPHVMPPATGMYVNKEATEQLHVISLEVSGGAQEPLLASLMLFCITTRCSQSTLPEHKPEYFTRVPSEGVDGLAFASPSLKLTRVDASCFHFDATDRRDWKDIAEAYNDTENTFEISTVTPATTSMCWSQSRAAWDLWLGLRIDEQGELLPDCVVQLQYSHDSYAPDYSQGMEQLLVDDWLIGPSQETEDDRLIGHKSAKGTTESGPLSGGVSAVKRLKTRP